LAECIVDRDSSPQFKALRDRWKREYPHVDSDLKKAFDAIEKDFRSAKNAWRVKAGTSFEVYKYRQNSEDIKRGSAYGWRIVALYDKRRNTLYPILVYPKTVMDDASDASIENAIREIRQILGYCISSECDGAMIPTEPAEVDANGSRKTKCNICRCVGWSDS
jgi:hypothetical protein